MAKSRNSRERTSAACSSWTDSVYLASRGSACRLSLVTLAGLDTRPSTNCSSAASSVRRAISADASSCLIFRNTARSEEHTSELQSLAYLVCRLLLEKKKKKKCII